MSKKICDIVLFPSSNLSKKAILASKKLEKLNSLFTLGDDKYFPHISLYVFVLNEVDMHLVKETLDLISENTNRLTLEAYTYGHIDRFIDAEYKKSTELTYLQENVIKSVNPISSGMRQIDIDRMKIASGEELQNYNDYRYRYVGSLFRPHMTLTRFSKDNQKSSDVLGDISEFSGIFDRIGLVELGDNGTAASKLYEANLF